MPDHEPQIQPDPAERRKTILIGIAKYSVVAVLLYFVISQLADNWSEVRKYEWDLNPWLLAVSLIAQIATYALFSRVWCLLLKAFGHPVPYKYAFRMAYLANLGRYVPGKIWPILALSYLGRRIRISEQVSVAAWAVALMLSLPGSFLVSVVFLFVYPELWAALSPGVEKSFIAVSLIPLVASVIVVAAPKTSLYLFNRVVRLFGRKPAVLNLSVGDALLVYFGYALGWIAHGLAFWLFLKAIAPGMDFPPAAAIGTFVLAYQIGYVAIFSPGGLGVRELVLATMLGVFLGPIAPAVAVASRLWSMAGEILASVVALRIKIPKEPEPTSH